MLVVGDDHALIAWQTSRIVIACPIVYNVSVVRLMMC